MTLYGPAAHIKDVTVVSQTANENLFVESNVLDPLISPAIMTAIETTMFEGAGTTFGRVPLHNIEALENGMFVVVGQVIVLSLLEEEFKAIFEIEANTDRLLNTGYASKISYKKKDIIVR